MVGLRSGQSTLPVTLIGMAKSKGIWLTVLCVFVAVLLVYLWIHRVEGFDGTDVPDSCGKYGWTYSNGLIQLAKDVTSPYGEKVVTQTVDRLTAIRLYTPTECKNVGGFYGEQNGTPVCYQLKNLAEGINVPNNVTGYYNFACAGLNKQPAPPPQECYVNKQVIGKPNVEFTVNIGNTPLKVQSGTVMLYTKDDCKKLGGAFVNSATIKTETGLSTRDWIVRMSPFLSGLTELDVNTALSLNGYDMGICKKEDGTILNITCAAGNTTLSKITDTITSGTHNAYNYISSIGS
jgi:hypothetical protein